MNEDVKYLKDKFKKLSPGALNSPFMPPPSVMIKKENGTNDLLDCLHNGALAYANGDYGVAINYFMDLLKMDQLNDSLWFYLVKTMVKLEQEIEMMNEIDWCKKNKKTIGGLMGGNHLFKK